MRFQTLVIIVVCLVVVLWVHSKLHKKKPEWLMGTVQNVISAKPLYSGTVYLIQYTHPGGSNEFISSTIPPTNFQFKQLGSGRIVVHN